MQHSVSHIVDDGTEYRVQYDNETGDGNVMHYLVYENGVLKLEVNHHKLPDYLTEEMFTSSVVVGAFWNCFSRALIEHEQQAEMQAEGGAMARLGNLVTPHMTLRPEHVEWAKTLIDRGHDVELLVKVVEDSQVERFARELNAGDDVEPDYTGIVVLSGEEGDEEDYVRPAYGKFVAIVLLVGLAAVGASTVLVEIIKLLGWR